MGKTGHDGYLDIYGSSNTVDIYQRGNGGRKTAQVELTQNQRDQLKAQGYTDGLIDIITKSVSYFPHRVWVVDNSGSKCKLKLFLGIASLIAT